MSNLSLTLLGHFQAYRDDEPIPGFRTNKVQALLIYLAAEPRSHNRESIMDLLWPDMPLDSARHNLRQILYYLRNTVPEVRSRTYFNERNVPLLVTNRRSIQLNLDAGVTVDINHFQALIDRTRQHNHTELLLCAECRRDLEDASALYKGDFLADFFLADSSPFETWASARRTKLQRQYLDTLGKLGGIYLAHSQFATAEEVVRTLVAADDLGESAQRQLLEVLARTGRRNEALAHYDALRRRLWDELAVAPEGATIELVEQIERGKLHEPLIITETATTLGKDYLGEAFQLQPRFIVEDTVPDAASPAFVAHERELSKLQGALDSAQDGRGQVRFVIGGAGQGKTTLMQEFSRRSAAANPDLVIVTGNCAAITGIGDPYLPFREALAIMTGDVEARWGAGLISQQQARQLWELIPMTLPVLVKHGPSLIDSLLSSQDIQERLASWALEDSMLPEQMDSLTAKKQSAGVNQKRIYAEYAAVLRAIAAQRPIRDIVKCCGSPFEERRPYVG